MSEQAEPRSLEDAARDLVAALRRMHGGLSLNGEIALIEVEGILGTAEPDPADIPTRRLKSVEP